jgi:hypothetical protein
VPDEEHGCARRALGQQLRPRPSIHTRARQRAAGVPRISPSPTTHPPPKLDKPWTTITLNDGTRIPSIGFGTWRIGNGDDTVANVKTAIDTGFTHVGPCPAVPVH